MFQKPKDKGIDLSMFSFHLLLLLFIICLNSSKGHNALTYFKSDVQQYFNNTSKMWHLYVKMFVYTYFKYHQNKIFVTEIINMYRYSSIFFKLRDKTVDTKGVFNAKQLQIIHVFWTSGKINIYLLSHKLNPHNYYFNFDLNSEIRLNLTFVVIHLGMSILNCNYDYLEVNSSNSVEHKYKYCGYHSNFNLYPEFNSITMIITLIVIMPFHLDTIFSVTDEMLIYNPIDFNTTWRTSDYYQIDYVVNAQCYTIAKYYYITSFLVSTIKIFRVRIRITNSKEQNYVIYDGPGYVFTVLTKNSHKSFIHASTFQCLVQFLLTYQFQPQFNTIFYYSYATGDTTVYKTFPVHSGTLIQMPFTNCLNTFCVHIVEANKNSQLNFTVLDMSVQSHEKSNCLFQGLYLGKIGKFQYLTIDELCSDINSSLHSSSMLNFHTRGSSLYMVLYWYNDYTDINATVYVNISKCKAVYLNICEYHQNCRKTNFINDWYRNFMYTVGHHIDLSYSGCGNAKYREYFGLPTGQCVVLVLMNKMASSSKIDIYKFFMTGICEINLYHGSGQSNINYINGFLENRSYIEILGRKDCFSSKQPICNKILIKKSGLEYYYYTFTNRFKQHFTNGILQASIKFNSFERRNQVNILLSGMKDRGQLEVHYALVSHPITDAISNTLLDAITSYYGSHIGVDWMFSIKENVQLGPQYKVTKCTFTIKINLILITYFSKQGYFFSGRSMKIFWGENGEGVLWVRFYQFYYKHISREIHFFVKLSDSHWLTYIFTITKANHSEVMARTTAF